MGPGKRGLNGVVSGYLTSTNFPHVDGLSTDPWDLRCHSSVASSRAATSDCADMDSDT